MPKKPPKEPKPQTAYRVVSANTGAQICGPYAKKADAKRERDRLNEEARTGRRKAKSSAEGKPNVPINHRVILHCPDCQCLPHYNPERLPDGVDAEVPGVVALAKALGLRGATECPNCKRTEGFVEVERVPEQIAHRGAPQAYEIVTDAGVVIA